MPFQDEGGFTTITGPTGAPIYGTGGAAAAAAAVAASTAAAAGTSAVDNPPTTIGDLAGEQGSAIILETALAGVPTASAPLQGLPTNPKVGGFYVFRNKPDTIYWFSPSNTWKAIVPITVA